MTWNSFHRRGEILRTVVAAANERRDGILPTDVPGVTAFFDDELALLGSLQLRWHTRLAGRIERELMNQPMDLEAAVLAAWQGTADEMPGVRAVLDRHRDHPLDDAMARAMTKATAKERTLLAVMAGQASAHDEASAARVGAGLEERARTTWRTPAPVGTERAVFGDRFLERLKAALAA